MMLAIQIIGSIVFYASIGTMNTVYWQARKGYASYLDRKGIIFTVAGWLWPLAPIWLPPLLFGLFGELQGHRKRNGHVGWLKSRRDKKQEERLNREKRIAQLERELNL